MFRKQVMAETKDNQLAKSEAKLEGQGKSDSPSPQFSEQDWVKNMVLQQQQYQQQLAQQGAVTTPTMEQLQQLNWKEARVDKEVEAAATTAVTKGDKELAR
ncbi:hypothetical protein CYMTET_29617 [Cymbomonas tetramitiformis]|uniref:Uncharacterized protein n=1 Tax=Cymbomonas tetramitiformis TaxID=36881 RepID=A0AAE0FKH3_9CHLO|nr:hypothetical protein CYMTET_29617 [Cymbomonas tetramitiformis]